jgi:hypothetical protein
MYALKHRKLYWATEDKVYRSGWAYINGRAECSSIYLVEDRKDALKMRKFLRRKLSMPSIRLVDMSSKKMHLELLTYAKLRYDY